MSLDLVRLMRDRYASMPAGHERAWTVTNAVALALGGGWGLVSKPSGSNWRGYSCDVIMRADGSAVDVLGDSEGEARPAWQPIEPIDPARWRPPVGTADPAPPVPGPTPTPAPVDLGPLTHAVEVLSAAVAELRASVAGQRAELDAARADLSALRARVEAHAHPWPIRISRIWGHSHTAGE